MKLRHFRKLELGLFCFVAGSFLILLSYTLESRSLYLTSQQKNQKNLEASQATISSIEEEKKQMEHHIKILESEITGLKEDLNQKILEFEKNPKVVEKEVLVKEIFIPHSYVNDIQIANFLKKEGIIKNAEEFVRYARKQGQSKLLKTGLTFTFKLNASYEEVLKTLTQ